MRKVAIWALRIVMIILAFMAAFFLGWVFPTVAVAVLGPAGFVTTLFILGAIVWVIAFWALAWYVWYLTVHPLWIAFEIWAVDQLNRTQVTLRIVRAAGETA